MAVFIYSKMVYTFFYIFTMIKNVESQNVYNKSKVARELANVCHFENR